MNSILIRLSKYIFVVAMLSTGYSAAETKGYQSPEIVEGAITTSLLDAKKLFDQGVVFIDVRNPRFYAKGHIPDAHHFDFKYNYNLLLLESVARKDQPIVIYCSGVKCSRSYHASAQAVIWGFAKVHYFRGGMASWRKAGYEVDSKDTTASDK